MVPSEKKVELSGLISALLSTVTVGVAKVLSAGRGCQLVSESFAESYSRDGAVVVAKNGVHTCLELVLSRRENKRLKMKMSGYFFDLVSGPQLKRGRTTRQANVVI